MRVRPWITGTLLVMGTIVGTLGGARMPDVSWALSGSGLLILVLAGLLLRFGKTEGEEAAGRDVGPELQDLASRLASLNEEAKSLPLSELVLRISALDAELVRPISERTPRMLKRLGAERFGEIFGTYASGERALARAWSAAADAHAPEALASLAHSVRLIREASDALSGG